MRLAEWSRQVKERDKECKRCRSTDRLKATRLNQVAGEYQLENGITLCLHCYNKHQDSFRKPRIRGNKPHYKTLERLMYYKISRNNQP